MKIKVRKVRDMEIEVRSKNYQNKSKKSKHI